MRTTYITAIIIALILAAWLASGVLGGEDTPKPASLADQNREQSRVDEETAPTKVRVAVLEATPQQRLVKVRGKTENKRTVDVKVELQGTIVSRPIDRGSVVTRGDLLCQLSVEDRQAALTEAQAALAQAQIEYTGALSLKEKGYNSDTAIAGAKARLTAAEANISRRNLDLQKINVRAPFSGIVEDVHLEIGDYVSPGANCATVVDMDPMLLVGRVSEQDVINLTIGQTAKGYLRNGQTVSGPVTFIGQLTDPTTRTYAIEIEIANPDRALRSGITTEIHIPVETVLAQKISPALISLDDAGEIGIRTVNEDNVVEFHHVDILADASDGIWVHGLPNRAGVITVGQELVTAGERVDPVFQDNGSLKAETPEPAEANVVTPHPSASSVNALPL
ncbi:MAG: efflux RND transporter periplasmic adaptor subunit [bacterium]